MHTNPRFAALALTLAFAVTGLSAAPNVEEQVVGPATAGGLYTVSPRGGHIAYAGMKGTKPFVLIDGVEGPVVDELFGPTGQGFFHPQQLSVMPSSPGGQTTLSPMMPVIFTADGAHHAYAARIGNEYVVIHDGKEIGRGPRESLALDAEALTLSPTGRHVYWTEKESKNSGGRWRLVM